MQQIPVIDISAIEQIRAIQQPGGEDLVGKIIGLFIDESARLQGCIAHAIESSDCDAVQAHAHSLKSCSANVGATVVTSLSQELEAAGRDRQTDALAGLLARLQSDLKAAIGELQILLDS